jgi:putative SOS response-associated peptidase YedK
MCGRFGLTVDERRLAGEFSELNPAITLPCLTPRYNIAPSQDVLVLRGAPGDTEGDLLRWGIGLPSTASGRARDLINVRAERATGGGLFTQLLERRRVLVPASWFYEWRGRGSTRRPLLIGPRDGGLLVFAGLQGRWTDRARETVPAVTILTTEPNALLADIHDRMPVVLPRAAWARWLDPRTGARGVADLLRPCDDEWLTVRPVSRLVNDATREGPELAAEVDEMDEADELTGQQELPLG